MKNKWYLEIWSIGFYVLSSLFFILSTELSFDEAYYWVFSNHLSWGYFDHPPLAAGVIKLFTIFGNHEFSVRIGFLILSSLGFYFLAFLIPQKKRIYWWGFLLCSPLLASAGFLAIPDSALIVCASFYLLCLYYYCEKDSLKNSLLLSLSIVLMLYSKYHGGLLVFFTLISDIRIVKRKSFWLVFLGSLILFIPHILWQIQHEFITFQYHLFMRPKAKINMSNILEYWGAQLILAGMLLGPWYWYYFFKKRNNHPFDRALKFCSIGTIIFFGISIFSKKMEANWTVLAGLCLGLYVLRNTSVERFNKKVHLTLLATSLTVGLLVRLLLIYPQTFDLTGSRAYELHGWKDWSAKLKDSHPGCSFLGNTYQIAAKLSFYLKEDIRAANISSRPNHFDILGLKNYEKAHQICYLVDSPYLGGKEVIVPYGKSLYLSTFPVIDDIKRLR